MCVGSDIGSELRGLISFQLSDLKLKAQEAESKAEEYKNESQEVTSSYENKMAALTESNTHLQSQLSELERQNSLLHGQAEKLSSQLLTEQAASRAGTDDVSSVVSSIISVGTESSQEHLWEVVRWVSGPALVGGGEVG